MHPGWVMSAKLLIGICGMMTLVFDMIGVYGLVMGHLEPTWETITFLISQFVSGAVTVWTIRN